MADYFQHVLYKLNEDRLEKNTFCDFTIKTESREFPVHKCLLGLMSDYFRGMFQVEMAEKYQNYALVKQQLHTDTVAVVLDFLYGNLDSVTMDNVQKVLEAADYLQIPKLLEYCAELISCNLSEKSFFQSWQCARQYNLSKLVEICLKFVSGNFTALSRRSELLSLQLAFFEDFLEARDNTTSEEQVFETIISWINFDKESRQWYFEDLFNDINLDEVSKSFLNLEISNDELVLENSVASKKVLLAMRKHMLLDTVTQTNTDIQATAKSKVIGTLSKSDNLNDDNESINLESQTLQPTQKPARSKSSITTHLQFLAQQQPETSPVTQIYGSETAQIFPVYSNSPAEPSKNLQQALALKDTSTPISLPLSSVQIKEGKIASTSKAKKVAPALAQLSEFVIIRGTGSPSFVRKYNVDTKKWSRLANINDVCNEGQLVRFKQSLYYLGGRLLKSHNSTVNVMQLNTKSSDSNWSLCPPMLQKRHRFGCAVFRNKIYVTGGRANKTELLSSVESFDFSKSTWKKEPKLNLVRAGCCLVEYQNKLYVVGGLVQRAPASYVNTMEVLEGNKWIFFGTGMKNARSEFAALTFNKRIFAIGGKCGENDYLSSVETFSKEKWKMIAPLKTCRAGHGACVLGNKIYVAGGKNKNGPVKSIEMYSPKTNKWEVIGDVKGDPVSIAMVALQ